MQKHELPKIFQKELSTIAQLLFTMFWHICKMAGAEQGNRF
jgi:hypothetical protein